MRLVGINSLKTGIVLGTVIRMADGRILLPAGAKLNDKFIERLKAVGVLNVYIQDDAFDDIDISPTVSDETKSTAINNIIKMFEVVEKDAEPDSGILKETVNMIVEEVRESTLPVNLVNTFEVKDDRILHAFNTCVLTAAMAIAYNYSPALVDEIATAALVHDISLKNQNDDLTDKQHPERTYQYLRKDQTLAAKTCVSTYSHHEYNDKSGFPRKVAVDEVFEGIQLLSMADMFDSLINGYWANGPMSNEAGAKLFPKEKFTANQAYQYICAIAGGKYSEEILEAFKRAVTLYPTGVTVVLKSGHKGVIAKQNLDLPDRPVLRLLDNPKQVVDLAKQPKLAIDHIEL